MVWRLYFGGYWSFASLSDVSSVHCRLLCGAGIPSSPSYLILHLEHRQVGLVSSVWAQEVCCRAAFPGCLNGGVSSDNSPCIMPKPYGMFACSFHISGSWEQWRWRVTSITFSISLSRFQGAFALRGAGTQVKGKHPIFSDNECHAASSDLPNHLILQLDRAAYAQMTKQLNSNET